MRKCSLCIYLSDEFGWCSKYETKNNKVPLETCGKPFTFQDLKEIQRKLDGFGALFEQCKTCSDTGEECHSCISRKVKKILEGGKDGTS